MTVWNKKAVRRGSGSTRMARRQSAAFAALFGASRPYPGRGSGIRPRAEFDVWIGLRCRVKDLVSAGISTGSRQTHRQRSEAPTSDVRPSPTARVLWIDSRRTASPFPSAHDCPGIGAKAEIGDRIVATIGLPPPRAVLEHRYYHGLRFQIAARSSEGWRYRWWMAAPRLVAKLM
jgi:hypothetical protein